MRLVTASTGKQVVKMSKSEWQQIGKKAGWIKSAEQNKDWLSEFEGGRGYSLSELWEKNVLGGGPSR